MVEIEMPKANNGILLLLVPDAVYLLFSKSDVIVIYTIGQVRI